MDIEETQTMIMLKPDESKVIHGSTISFNSINYKVFSKNWYNYFIPFCLKSQQKQILYNVSGIFKPGMNAIMGPTGSGKSTLLDILGNRKDRQGLTGELLLDGQPYRQDFNSRIGYVVQDDILSETLSVRENLMFSANLRLPRNITFKAKMNIVNLVISQLELEKCADSKIGAHSNRKVSGGERKRTNIGMELILSPTVLLLDEPTSGLDSSTANNVIECLSQLSQRGHTIIFSIHQPRYSIFKLFDNLLLIGAGHCVYHGSASGILPFFSSIGFTCEEHDNPADFILDVCQGIRHTSYSINNIDNEIDQRKDEICLYLHSVFTKSSINDSILQQIQDAAKSSDEKVNKKVQILSRPCLVEIWYVSQRAFRNSFRNSTLMIMQTVVPICLAILVGFLYMNTDHTIENGVKNRLGAIFFIVSNEVFINLSALELFIKERVLFAHENISGYYRVSTYFISKLMCDIVLLRLFPSIVFSLISYFMIQFQQTIEKFLIYQLAIFATAVCSASVCFFVSASVETIGVANLVSASFCVVMLVFTGYLVDLTNVVKFLAWIKWVSLFRYASNVITINEFTHLKLCLMNNASVCLMKGEHILDNHKIDYDTTWDLWKNFVALAAITFFFFALTFIQLVRLPAQNRR
ncbi:unnamed protein product [Rotaria magnacalcarata]|uniref:ABC transporter domain-containing protein n=1 Tax=Rotaria magnacalcarata TaxID=392030 RepID=A0A816E111_9BILA|nr:unnamed protein product [Rotaria magnacalcarata]CAF1644446.1 unnamed protein product [Rotaria magnacalcarata]CAF2004469.1 unnamed protein product [Rotaria magnacalcarata]CAF2051808.1 unnamed protein product [Rotaria magnacalcarata]CAF2145148.1 unnamed protein product [Rotaria magnacalcarata]